jgi:exoribonuclease R
MPFRELGRTDIHFDDPRLARLMEHINRMSDELQSIMQMVADGQEGEVLTKRSHRDYDARWAAPTNSGGGGGGETEETTADNVGSGAGLFRDKEGATLNFRSIIGENGVEVAVVGDHVRIRLVSAQAEESLEPLLIAGAFG